MFLQKLRRRVQHALRGLTQDDAGQTRALLGALRLFGALLILTLVARAASGAALPTITVTTASANVLVETLKTTGMIAAADGTPFSTPEGLLVEAVYPAQGETISVGAPLARFMPDSVSQALAAGKAKRAQIAQQIAKLSKGENADPYSVGEAQSILDSAATAYESTRRKGEAAVAEAAQQRDAAQKALTDFLANPPAPSSSAPASSAPSSSSAIASSSAASASSESAPPQTAFASADTGASNAMPAAHSEGSSTQSGSTAQNPGETQTQLQEQTLRQALQQAEAALKAAQSNAESANEGAYQAVLSAQRARDSAQHSYQKSASAAADQTAQSRADAGVLTVTLNEQDALIASLTALLQSDCVFSAPATGTLTQLALVAGTPSPAVGGAIADTSDGYALTFALDEAQAKKAAVGMSVQVTQKSLTAKLSVSALSAQDKDGSITATVRLPEASGAWQSGAAQVNAELSRENHTLTLPPMAVHEDMSGSFVYYVETRGTVLGDQEVLVRIPVNIEARTAERVAVTGALSPQMRIANTTTKPLQTEARVRVEP